MDPNDHTLTKEDYERYEEARKPDWKVFHGLEYDKAVALWAKTDRDSGVGYKFTKALTKVYRELALLPFHSLEVNPNYSVQVCWICHPGGKLARRPSVLVKAGRRTTGVVMDSTTDDPHHSIRLHMTRYPGHSNRKLQLLNMSGCESLKLEEKITALEDKAAAAIDKRETREESKRPKRTKGKSKVAKLEEELQAVKRKQEVDDLKMELLAKENEILQLKLSASANVASESTASRVEI